MNSTGEQKSITKVPQFLNNNNHSNNNNNILTLCTKVQVNAGRMHHNSSI